MLKSRMLKLFQHNVTFYNISYGFLFHIWMNIVGKHEYSLSLDMCVSCVSSKVTVYRLEWQCVFVLNKLYCVDMVVGQIVSMDVYVTCTVESCIQDTCITFHNKVGIFLISKGHNRLFW